MLFAVKSSLWFIVDCVQLSLQVIWTHKKIPESGYH